MLKKLVFILILASLVVSGVSAQEATSEPTAEPTSEVTAVVTPEVTTTLPPGALRTFDGPGSYTVTQMYGSLRRDFVVYIPKGYANSESVPLVIVMHGAGGTGANTEGYTGFDTLADSENFVAVYPDGVNNGWNDNRPAAPGTTPPDDVLFLDNITRYMGQQLKIDPARIYATGYSMGGMMSYRLGCEQPGIYAAVGIVASTMPEYLVGNCSDTAPIPIIIFQGTDDPIVPWMGEPGGYLSAAQTIGFWGNHNHCSAFTVDTLPDTSATDHTRVMRQSLTGCAADMVMYGVYLGGHTWPGHPFTGVPQLGQTTLDVDATAMIWDFFKAHPKAAK